MATAKFPTSVATDADLLVVKNRAQTTLVGALNGSDTTFTLAADVFAVNMAITIDSEIILITAKSGATVTACTRAYDGTAAASHTNGKLVSAYVDAIHHNQVSAEIQAIETALGAAMVNVPSVTYPIAVNKGGTGATTQSAALTAIMGAAALPIAVGGTGAATQSAALTALMGAASLPIAVGGTAATTAAGARASLSAAILGANNDITSLTALSTPLSVAQGGTGAATLTGIPIGSGTAALTVVAAASQLQAFRRKANVTGTVYEFASPDRTVSTDYNFPVQATPENLSPVLKTVTLTPVPLGVNGADTAHYVGIFNNSGVFQESALINGGSAVSGASSGTLTFAALAGTYATGAYKIGSVTAGIQEAINAAGSLGTVVIPAGNHSTYATITKGSTQNVAIVGQGSSVSNIAAQFTSGDVMYVHGGSGPAVVRGLAFTPGVARVSGAELHSIYNIDGVIDDIHVGGTSYIGIVSENFIRTLHSNWRVVNSSFRGVEFLATDGGSGGMASNLNVSLNGAGIAGIFFQAAAATSFAGMTLENIGSQSGQYSVYMDGNGGTMNEFQFTNMQLDGATVCGFFAGGTGSGNKLTIRNMLGGSTGGKLVYIGKIYSNVYLSIETSTKTGNVNGIDLDGCTNVTVDGGIVNGSNGAGAADASVNVNANSGQATTNVTLRGLKCGMTNPPSIGLNVSANAHTGLHVQDCDFYATTPIIDANTVPTIYSGWVTGLSNTVPTVASAATVTFPRVAHGGQLIITGNTNITAVAGLYAGQRGTLLNTGGPVYLIAGASIGNTVGLSPNVPSTFFFDGTKIWIDKQDTLVSVAAATNSTASIAATALLTAPTPGVYRVAWALNTGSVSGGSGTSLVTIGWTDAVGAKTSAGAALTLAAAANQAGSVLVNVASGNITYATTFVAGSGGNYNAQLTAELVKGA